MSNQYPEIRPDLTYIIQADNYKTWRAWSRLYKDLPNVKVELVMKGKK